MARKEHNSVLPDLSVAKVRRKADQYSLGNLHQQSNALAKQAILQELHSTMQLKASRMRLHDRQGLQGPSESEIKIPSGGFENNSTSRTKTHPDGNIHSTVLSRIPVPVHRGTGLKIDGQSRSTTDREVSIRRTVAKSSSHGGSKGPKQSQQGHENFQYTWGSKGRLHELRIRYLARKFFCLWNENAFSTVKPSVIRNHYNSRLLRKAFVEWREFWWTQRKEWTLLIRAEYHYRYKVYQRVWLGWRTFIVREKVKNAKKDLSSIHASKALLTRTLQAWKEYIRMRHAKTIVLHRALAFRDSRLPQRCWAKWKSALQQQRMQRDIEMFAVQHWAENLMQKAWTVWKARTKESQELKQKEIYAQHLYEKTLLARCYFQGLLPYVLHRRDRRQSNAQASQLYMDKLMAQAWQHWHLRWYTCRSLAQRQEQVDQLGTRAKMRRVLVHWKFYIHVLHVERMKEAVAREHHNTQLKRLGILALRLAVVKRRQTERRTRQAIEFHQEMLVKRCWSQWMARCEDNEELKLFAATRKARLMYRKRLLGAVMRQWVDYTTWRRHRKAQYARADTHYASCLLPKCFSQLKLNVDMMKRKREQQEQAGSFYREGILGQYFYRWWHSYQTSQDVRMMERMAILHHEGVVAKRFLQEWRRRTRERLREAEKWCLAVDHHQTSLCIKALKRWKEHTVESLQRQEFEKLASRHINLQRSQKAWVVWRQYVACRRHKTVKRTKADSHYHQHQMRMTFSAWKSYVGQMKTAYQVVAAKESVVNQRRLRYAFNEWKRNAELLRADREREETAVIHWKMKMESKVWSVWRQYAQQHAADAAIKAWRLDQLRAQLNNSKLKRAFLAWRAYKTSVAEERRRQERADAFRRRQLLKRCLHQWQSFRLLCVKKSLMARQALWLNKTRVQAKFFIRWKYEYSEAQKENHNTVMALWLWSMRLQQRVIRAWIHHAAECRRKKLRIAHAMEQRRQDLLKEGVRRWLSVAADLSRRRAGIAAQHHAQTTYKSYQVVHRCAMHWRQKTLANRGRRKHRPHSDRRPVTSKDRHHHSEGRSGKENLPPPRGRVISPPLPATSVLMPSVSLSGRGHFSPNTVVGLPESGLLRPITGKVRPQPRRPDFLRDSLQRAGLWKHHSGVEDVTVPTSSDESEMNMPSHTSAPVELVHPDNMSVPLPVSTHEHPPETSLVQPNSKNQPVPVTQQRERITALEPGGGTSSSHHEGQPDSQKSFEIKLIPEREPKDVDSATVPGSQKQIDETKDERGRPTPVLHRPAVTKAPVLLPPSAFMSGVHDVSSHQKQGTWNVIESESDAVTVLTGAHHQTKRGGAKPHNNKSPHLGRLGTTTHQDTEWHRESDVDDDKTDPIGDGVYEEIQRLKETLQSYQDMKSKLKNLRSQEGELQGWLKELGRPSEVDDSAALLIGDELKQVREEMAHLTARIQENKPNIKLLLARISALTQQASDDA